MSAILHEALLNMPLGVISECELRCATQLSPGSAGT
jgi:hypothetical protein